MVKVKAKGKKSRSKKLKCSESHETQDFGIKKFPHTNHSCGHSLWKDRDLLYCIASVRRRARAQAPKYESACLIKGEKGKASLEYAGQERDH